MSKKHLLVGLAAAGVLGLGVAAPTVAFAEDATPTPSASSTDQGRAEHRAAFAEALAKELGVSTDRVTAALEKVREQHKPADRPERADRADRAAMLKERLDQAVKDGKLTQEQADAITKAAESGVFPGPGGRGGHGGHGPAGN